MVYELDSSEAAGFTSHPNGIFVMVVVVFMIKCKKESGNVM